MGFKLTTLVVIGTDCTGSCKSNFHTINEARSTTQVPVGNKGSEHVILNLHRESQVHIHPYKCQEKNMNMD
jgi:hypothetical protein